MRAGISPPTKPTIKIHRITFRTKYILASLLLLILVFATITLNQNNGTSSKYIGEVREVKHSVFPSPHTDITYGLKPAPFTSLGPFGQVKELKLIDGIYIRIVTYAGDLRGVFQVGGFYIVSDEKLPFTWYPEMRQCEASGISSMSILVYGSGGSGDYSWLNDAEYGLVFRGNYYGAFEYMHYYKISWFGDILLSYNKTS